MKKNILYLVLFFLSFQLKAVPADKFGYKIGKEDVFLFTQGNIYLVQPVSITSGGKMMYFAAKDFTANRDLLVQKLKEAKAVVDEKDRKVIDAKFSVGSRKKIYSDYQLELFLEIRKEFPFLAIYSKFKYLGKGTHTCGINWAVDSAYERFKYYTIPKKGKLLTYKLKKTRRTKIGQANWIYVHSGKGEGAGLIAPAVILGKGKDFIFINSVPPKKKLKKGESIDVFMIFMPINKNFKILPELYEKVKVIKWEYK